MYKLFLKIATRYLIKNKLYSFINIFGLAIGIASFVLIMLYVNYEQSYDKFEGSENVYRVYMDYLEGGEYVPGDANAYIVSGPALKEELPEILDFTRLRRRQGMVLLYDNLVFDQNSGALTDPSFFDIFDRKLEKGDVSTALSEPYSIVLSASLSKKIFGSEDPMGKTLKIAGDDESTFKVTGVLDTNNPNTHLNNDFLISFQTFYTWKLFENDWKFTWNQNEYYTYIKVDKNADLDLLNQKVMAFSTEGLKNERHHLEPIEDIHLNSNKPYEAETNGSASSIRLLAIIAFITLLLSWMNYMSLSSSKSLERAKEIGIRKVVGAKRPQLILQFLIESAMLNFMAIILAIIAVYLLLPGFSRFVEQDLGFGYIQLKGIIPYFGVILLGASLTAFYPAFVLSNYSPTKVLKGKLQTSKNGFNFRKALIVGQFIATIALLAGTFVANKQIRFLKERPIGADLDQLVALKGQKLTDVPDSLLVKKYETLIEEIRKSPYVAEVAGAGTYPGDDFSNMNSNIGITFPDGREDVKRIWYNYGVQPEYFDLIGMEFVAGEGFKRTSQASSPNVVINEKMARFMGIVDMKEIIGKTIKFWDVDWTVTGVISDYNHFGLKSPVEPLIIRQGRNTGNILVKFNKQVGSFAKTSIALEELTNIWHQILPESTYSYTFLDQKFEAQYKEDRKFAKAFQVFTILAILIASLGLFGLTSYTVLQRKKEIGIRKVNGATISEILSILNIDFVKWVGLAFIFAVPISWYAMNKWLEGFAYKTSMSWWVFALAGVSALVIALLTVSWQSYRAAVVNPVDALREE
ncbi:ABC transporter permease [Maribacter sp. IgM3_T14_3]|uniref:ABC transporter permease n=1 Tax=Maribacter sp. IgM3_T14_3 TaxID=3415140 RepID=UPI003C6F666E